ncbi:hypothetical protein BJ878DRAFT_4294 [Calycina marina]|uniref:Uncharacterized protein n=1 Tax=Calycina marina TaxID=1763456 RepID=A0A9P7ZB70_9HELO|nr:hypothetical protein BJ878DRAFT_4294 [Calycina marina]
MSFHQLGISHYPKLHRQLTERDISQDNPSLDVAQDSRDVLIERLNSLVTQLPSQNELEGTAIKDIHSKVDQIEVVLRGQDQSPKSSRASMTTRTPNSPLSSRGNGNSGEADSHIPAEKVFCGPSTPTQSISMRFRGEKQPKEPHVSPFRATEIARRAEKLAENLAKTVEELRSRKDEVEETNSILLQKAHEKTKTIASLEQKLESLQDDYEASQAELGFLRIQLQAIEAQTSHIIQDGEDPDLTLSITNWKTEWIALQEKFGAKKKYVEIL